MKLASRIADVKPSATLEVAARARALRQQGVDIVSFTAGEPDFDTPQHICEAARTAIEQGKTKYLPAAGLPELKQAVAREAGVFRGVDIDPARVVISVGAKHALFNFFMALLDPGDEVLIPAPYWVSYPDQVRIAGGVPVFVTTNPGSDWSLKAQELEKKITPDTRAIVINSPSNPTGALYAQSDLIEVLDVCRKHDLWVVADEIYSKLVYDGLEYTSVLSLAPDMSERIVIVDGTSKTFAMTGWRIGWAIAPEEMASAMARIQGQSTSNATSIAQYATLAAFTHSMDFLDDWRKAFSARRDAIVAGLNSIDGVSCSTPKGAFYAFPDFSRHTGKGGFRDDVDLAKFLINEAKVAVVPGSPFGAPGFLRLTYSVSKEEIEKGLDRISRALVNE